MTRKQLVEFLRSTGLEGSYSCETFANHMIEKGIVKVDAPQEVYKCIHCGVFLHHGEIHTAHGVLTKSDLIRFREVVEE